MAVITNPLYFTTLLILIVSAYFTHRFGLSGPLVQVVGQMYKEIHRQALEKMREAFREDHAAVAPPRDEKRRILVEAEKSLGGITQDGQADGVGMQQ